MTPTTLFQADNARWRQWWPRKNWSRKCRLPFRLTQDKSCYKWGWPIYNVMWAKDGSIKRGQRCGRRRVNRLQSGRQEGVGSAGWNEEKTKLRTSGGQDNNSDHISIWRITWERGSAILRWLGDDSIENNAETFEEEKRLLKIEQDEKIRPGHGCESRSGPPGSQHLHQQPNAQTGPLDPRTRR